MRMRLSVASSRIVSPFGVTNVKRLPALWRVGGGGHNKRDSNRHEDCGAVVDEPLVLRKLFKALVEYRNQLKAEQSLHARKYHACFLDGLAATLIRLLVQLPRSTPISIVHVSVFQ